MYVFEGSLQESPPSWDLIIRPAELRFLLSLAHDITREHSQLASAEISLRATRIHIYDAIFQDRLRLLEIPLQAPGK